MKERKGELLQTVERAMDVLYLFHEYNGSTLSFVAETMGMSTTVVYRILSTLTDGGFLRQDNESKKYYLGEKLLILGYRAIESNELKHIAEPILSELKERTGFGAILTVCVDQKSLCIQKLDESEDLQLAMYVGGMYPLYKGASNRPLLAFMEEQKKNSYLESLDMPLVEFEKLKNSLIEIQNRGYDYSSGLLTQGLFAIGFPVYGAGGKLVAAISAGGYCSELNESKLEHYAEQVKMAALSLSRLMGADVS